ncbi:hypothetical protein C8034_v012179 [Colletotrichum sidae]|uniref:DNA/RNA-binding protein Alba-like domain-containing protein n=1 Tax=Colletotrichum sidae TaxID=1347389 RepID=A0A4R8TGY6_9PEZI|nr:hypothetical protein C8034_v012179 [Colletotrichum sidae]
MQPEAASLLTATPAVEEGGKKRKSPIMIESQDAKTTAKSSLSAAAATPTLASVHETLLAELRSKYDVLPAFTISSTKIHKRVTWLLLHLRKDNGDARKRAVLLHARPAEVGKMITICEQVKRLVAQEKDGRWYQYNLMYDLPPPPPKKEDVVEETMVGGEDRNSDDDDDFEIMESRFEKAVVPQKTAHPKKSLSIFLSLEPMPDLKAKEGVTQQTNES